MPTQEEAGQQESAKDLKSWWNTFRGKSRKGPAHLSPAAPAPGSIFAIPLTTSIKYANVAISLLQDDGNSYTYGYIPIVVAKCGVFLKERAIEVEGIFRLAGSARRMNMLQEIFNTPPSYGKDLEWSNYTVHDAANVLRRYLNQLPEPIVPLDLYEHFRNPLRQHQKEAVGNVEAQESDIGNFDYDGTIQTYRSLITQLPPLNRQLLLYILDMLAIFAAKSNVNHMTAANLAVIFQPGMLHHPSHDKLPHEYRLSQDVVIFLIDQQDNFLLGMPGTAADERTKQEIESGPSAAAAAAAAQPATPARAAGVHRSVSTNSRSTNSSRLAGIRRNMSVSSKGSRTSQANLPGTPGTPGTPGVHRSNTVPSRRSPVVSQARFNKPSESPGAVTPDATTSPGSTEPFAGASKAADIGSDADAAAVAAAATATTAATTATATSAISTSAVVQTSDAQAESVAPSLSQASVLRDQSKERLLGDNSATQAGAPSTSRRGLANLLRPQPSDDGQSRQPNKLRKKRFPSEAQPSGHSSAASLSADPEYARSPFTSPLQKPVTSGDEGMRHVSGSTNGGFSLTETAPTPRTRTHPIAGTSGETGIESPQGASDTATLKPKSEAASGALDTAESNADTTDASIGPEQEGERRQKRKKRWTFSVSGKRGQDDKQQQQQQQQLGGSYGSSTHFGAISEAELSKAGSSTAERSHRRSSTANNDKPVLADFVDSSGRRNSKELGSQEERSPTFEGGDKGKGPINWFKQKLAERKEKEDAKERAKSPKRGENFGRHPSSTNIDAAANGDHVSRQRSTDVSETIPESAEEESARPQPNSTLADISMVTAQQESIHKESTAASTEVTTADGTNSRESVFQTSSIEDYMGDSDREKLATAREVQAMLTRQEEEEKLSHNPITAIGRSGTITGPEAREARAITVDPAYTQNSVIASSFEDPSTPKASEAATSIAQAAERGPQSLKPDQGEQNMAA